MSRRNTRSMTFTGDNAAFAVRYRRIMLIGACQVRHICCAPIAGMAHGISVPISWGSSPGI